MIDIIYNREKIGLLEVLRSIESGDRILCHICNEELLRVVSKDDVLKYRRDTGLYCPKDNNHVHRIFLLNIKK
jgi:hypothetical protein